MVMVVVRAIVMVVVKAVVKAILKVVVKATHRCSQLVRCGEGQDEGCGEAYSEVSQLVRYGEGYSQVSQLVRYREGRGEPVILHDGAGCVSGAHGPQLGQPQRVAVLGERIAANVLPGTEQQINT